MPRVWPRKSSVRRCRGTACATGCGACRCQAAPRCARSTTKAACKRWSRPVGASPTAVISKQRVGNCPPNCLWKTPAIKYDWWSIPGPSPEPRMTITTAPWPAPAKLNLYLHIVALRAAHTLQKTNGVERGADIVVDKRLPMGAGLGGGSSDAATVLVALNRLWNAGLSEDELAELGLTLGASVPVFVRGRAAWAVGGGERLTPVDMPAPWY